MLASDFISLIIRLKVYMVIDIIFINNKDVVLNCQKIVVVLIRGVILVYS